MQSATPSTDLTHPRVGTVTIGRSRTCTLTIRHPRVSRVHCSLNPVDGGFVIRDHSSRNGTWVLGERIDQRYVEAPITFRVSQFPVRLHADGSVTETTDDAIVAPKGRGPATGPGRSPRRLPALAVLMILCTVSVSALATRDRGVPGTPTLDDALAISDTAPTDDPVATWVDPRNNPWHQRSYINARNLIDERTSDLDTPGRNSEVPLPHTPPSDAEWQAAMGRARVGTYNAVPRPGSIPQPGTSTNTQRHTTVPFRRTENPGDSECNLLLETGRTYVRLYHVRSNSVVPLEPVIRAIAAYDSPRSAEVLFALREESQQLIDRLEGRMRRLKTPKTTGKGFVKRNTIQDLAQMLASILVEQHKNLRDMEVAIVAGMSRFENSPSRVRALELALQGKDERLHQRLADTATAWDDTDTIPVLITALKTHDSSLRHTIRGALVALTGRRHHSHAAWQEWWDESPDLER